jgi:hypothetical protein
MDKAKEESASSSRKIDIDGRYHCPEVFTLSFSSLSSMCNMMFMMIMMVVVVVVVTKRNIAR